MLSAFLLVGACAGPRDPAPRRTVIADPAGGCLLYGVDGGCLAAKSPRVVYQGIRQIDPDWL